nr:MAG TPA: hypothetical protein [Caudoviricetes sp.]
MRTGFFYESKGAGRIQVKTVPTLIFSTYIRADRISQDHSMHVNIQGRNVTDLF